MTPEPLTLDHRAALTAIWKPLCQTYHLQFPEFSFANVFLFRREHQYCFIPTDPPLVRGEFRTSRCHYLIPNAPPEQLKLENTKRQEGRQLCFFPIPDQWLYHFQRDGVNISSSRTDSDYVFRVEKLKDLPGRKLSSRRNLLKQLMTQHKLEIKNLTNDEIPDAFRVLELWQQQSHQPKEKTDYFPTQDALTYLEQLHFHGRILYVDDEPAGFTLWELLTPNTALLHFSKALHDIKGITPFLYQDFAKNLPETVLWINLEQDLGLPSLRQAKEVYDPDTLLTKWRVCI